MVKQKFGVQINLTKDEALVLRSLIEDFLSHNYWTDRQRAVLTVCSVSLDRQLTPEQKPLTERQLVKNQGRY